MDRCQSPTISLNRYKSVIKYFKAHMGDGPDACSINADELKLLSKAYHHLADAKRDRIRRLKVFLDTVEDDDDGKCATVVDTVRSVFASILDDTRDDLIAICDDVIDTVDGIFLRNAVDTPERVLLYWMKGDFYKYIVNDICRIIIIIIILYRRVLFVRRYSRFAAITFSVVILRNLKNGVIFT